MMSSDYGNLQTAAKSFGRAASNWEEEFAKSPEDGLFAFPVGFEPPIYNATVQQAT